MHQRATREAAAFRLGFLFFHLFFFAIALPGSNGSPFMRALASEVPVENMFQARCAKLALDADRTGMTAVAGRDGWLFPAAELRHIGAGPFWGDDAAKASRARNPEHADPLPAILDFKTQLEKRGIELLLVPAPAKAIVYPDHLPDAVLSESDTAIPPRMDVNEQAFFGLLKTNDVEVLDLAPLFLANRNNERGPVCCRQDSHWSGVGCVLAAQAIADHVKKRPWYEGGSTISPAAEWTEITFSGDLRSNAPDSSLPQEKLHIRKVGIPSELGLQPIPTDEASQVILIGDSHNLVFHAGGDMHSHQAGLADQLAIELGFPVDLLGVRGSGATPARINLLRRAQKNPEYWTNRKIVIWCFSVREFTQSDGWRKVPIAP